MWTILTAVAIVALFITWALTVDRDQIEPDGEPIDRSVSDESTHPEKKH